MDVQRPNWKLFENILSQCVLVEPACLPQVCDQISYYRTKRYPISKSLWSKCLNIIVHEKVPLGQSSEAAWAMWLMKMLNIRLAAKSSKVIGNSEDSIVGLMALGLADSGLTKFKYLEGLNHFNNPLKLFSNQWLLCYQGNLMKWLGNSSGKANLATDPIFSYLESKNVSFFDINITPPKAIRNIFPPSYTVAGGGGY